MESRGAKTVSQVQMVFQNPFDTLNPSMTIGDQIIRVLQQFEIGDSDADRENRMLELLDLGQATPRVRGAGCRASYPVARNSASGIARAFAGRPKLVVADEPVSALDVSVQAAVTKLLTDIQRESRTTMLFISHDLGVVRYLSDRIVVMYLGRIMEQGSTEDIFAPPYHPYTEALLSAVPVADTHVSKRHVGARGRDPFAPDAACRAARSRPLPVCDCRKVRQRTAPGARYGQRPRHRLSPRTGDAERDGTGDRRRRAR